MLVQVYFTACEIRTLARQRTEAGEASAFRFISACDSAESMLRQPVPDSRSSILPAPCLSNSSSFTQERAANGAPSFALDRDLAHKSGLVPWEIRTGPDSPRGGLITGRLKRQKKEAT